MKDHHRVHARIVLALSALCSSFACSGGESPRPHVPGTADATLSAAESAEPSQSSGVDCRNPSRSFQCSGEGCCAAEPSCPEGQLPFADVCGCGCLAASCQPGNRNYATTSPHECSSGSRPQCQPELEAPFDDECGCGCTDLVDLPADCDVPNRTFYCIGYGCGAGANFVACPEGMRFFENQCGAGCDPVNAADACEAPNRTFICRGGRDCCVGIDWACAEGTRGFADECGCGCQP